MIKKALLAIVVFLFCIAWSNDPDVNTPVCTAPGDQDIIGIVSDGAGGAIIAWSDERGSDCDIYMQRLSASGTALWGKTGRLIHGGPNEQRGSNLVEDGKGGVFFVAGDETAPYSYSYDWYIKRVDSSGNVLWTSDKIAGFEDSPSSFVVVSDGAGGVFFTWKNKISGDYSIYAQRVDRAGNILWASGGIPVSAFEGYPYWPVVVADGRGGAYIAWKNRRISSNYKDIFCQRIDGSGNLLWGTQGVKVSDEVGTPMYQQVDALDLHRDNQDGVYVSWNYKYANQVYMQRLNSAGNKLWTEDGVLVFKQPWGDDSYTAGMVSDNTGGLYMLVSSFYFSYSYNICEYALFLQHIDPFGHTAWGSEGVHIYGDYLADQQPNLIAGAGGKAVVAWEEWKHNNVLLKTQLFNKAGTPQWASGGLTVSDAKYRYNDRARMISNGSGGGIAAWTYDRDIYAQNICVSGGLGDCALPIAVIEGDRFGGVAPAEIHFDGSGSYDPDGKVVQWDWDLGDGNTASTAKVTHTYNDIGLYKVTLRVKDDSGQWSKPAKVSVKTFSVAALTAVFEFNTGPIKAKKKGHTSVRASLYDKPKTPEERPIPIDLGLTFETDKGTWLDDLAFSSTTYARSLVAETPGTATVKAVLAGQVLGTAKVTFSWLSPPANVTVDLKTVRSLFRGVYNAHISWSENPAEVFTPAKYRIYRSTDGAAYELVAEVDADTFSYSDENLPASSEYSWAVSMVDDAGDESERSAANFFKGAVCRGPRQQIQGGQVYFFKNSMIFSSILTLTARVFSNFSSWLPVKAEGSSKLQCSRSVIPGNTGHLSPLLSSQTVIT